MTMSRLIKLMLISLLLVIPQAYAAGTIDVDSDDDSQIDDTYLDFSHFVTGIPKCDGAGAITMAVQGTDYYAPGGTDVADADVADDITLTDITQITNRKLDDMSTPDDNTDLNATTSYHGLLPKLDNDTSHFFRGDGTWAAAAYDDIGNPDASGSIGFGAYTGTYTSATDGWGGLIVSNTTADNSSDTTLLSLKFNDANDANSIFLEMIEDADGTPATVFKFSNRAFTLGTDSTIDGIGSISLSAASDYQVSGTSLGATSETLTNKTIDNDDNTLNDMPCEVGMVVSDETTDLTTGVAKVTFRMPWAMTLTSVRANVNTAPTGAALTVDINESGTTVLSTKLTIDATEETSTTAATPAVISDSALADDAEITVDIDQIGSGDAGKGLKIWLIGKRNF